MTTPPTEDRDWKQLMNRFIPDTAVGALRTREAIIAFIESEIATAEARGYERGYKAAEEDADKPTPLT